jgi:hypothetical protein
VITTTFITVVPTITTNFVPDTTTITELLPPSPCASR